MLSINNHSADRGQVGIGTLIVFIAMVLVAAIAAGVLINTAGLLQSQAEATGQESADQVSNSLTVTSITGEVIDDGGGEGEIGAVAVDVRLGPGSNSIELTDVTISWTGEEDSATFMIQEANNLDDLTGNDDTESVDTNALIPTGDGALDARSDTATIYIVADNEDVDGDWRINIANDGYLESDLPLQEGDEAELTITTADGGQTFPVINTPSLLEIDEGVRL